MITLLEPGWRDVPDDPERSRVAVSGHPEPLGRRGAPRPARRARRVNAIRRRASGALARRSVPAGGRSARSFYDAIQLSGPSSPAFSFRIPATGEVLSWLATGAGVGGENAGGGGRPAESDPVSSSVNCCAGTGCSRHPSSPCSTGRTVTSRGSIAPVGSGISGPTRNMHAVVTERRLAADDEREPPARRGGPTRSALRGHRRGRDSGRRARRSHRLAGAAG